MAEEKQLFPALSKPVQPVAPEVPYTNSLIWLAFSPKLEPGAAPDAVLSVRALPYRLLDGNVDVAPDTLARHFNVASVNEVAARDEKFATVLAQLAGVISTYLE